MQKSVLQIVQAVAAEFNLPQPSVVVSNQEASVQQLLSFVRSVCEDLLEEFDWQVLQSRYTFTTSDGVDEYAFPSDIQRFSNGTFFDQTNRWPLRGPLTPSQWEWLLTTNVVSGPFERFRVVKDKLFLYPVPGTTPYNFVFEYVSNSYVRDASLGTPKSDFTQDADVIVFDHRVVIYGVKLKWMTAKGLDSSAALSDYVRALEFAKGSDSPAPTLSLIGGTGIPLLSTANIADGGFGA